MSKKNAKILSLTAGAAIASMLIGADETEASTYKVKPGDTLWSIAQKHNLSVSQIKSINQLASDNIYPNQILKTNTSTTTSPSKASKTNASVNNTKSVSSKATTYTVKAGDTLSSIANKHNISLQQLMSWNNLSTTLIYPGNELIVSKDGASNSDKTKSGSSKNQASNAEKTTVYTVKSGDTLTRISKQYGVSVANLKKWNNLTSDTIYVGQKLNISASAANSKPAAEKKETSNNQTSANKIVQIAESLAGTPYKWGGSSPSGFDCSGFIYYVHQQAGIDISRQSSEGYYNRSYYINQPQPGDLVFFANTYKKGISHLGIYLGDNQFIHADSSGVRVNNLNESYWKSKFDGFKRFY